MWAVTNFTSATVEPAIKQFVPPCQAQCPINEDIQRTNILISLLPDDMEKAKVPILAIGDYLFERNPLFTVCGYVCGLCELACNYRAKGGAIRRRLLKRFISDIYTDYLYEKEEYNIPKHKQNIAIVGGGPAGLFCAFYLSKRGYRVTIFEQSERLGGALWLIPRYRLPEKVLTYAIDNLIRIAGIDVKFGVNVSEGKHTLDKILNQGYDAIFIAKGTPSPRTLVFNGEEVANQNLSGIMYGHTFLYEVSHGNIKPDYFVGKKVFVVGGGNVAFDAARTARRLGGETTIICLECEDRSSEDAIPADSDEVRGAWQEGVKIFYSRGVSKIFGQSERLTKIESPKCTKVYDAKKGFNPQFDLSDCLYLKADVLIITVGQGPDKHSLHTDNLLDEKGRLVIDPLTLQSLKRPQVFIGGDLRKVGFMVDAMRDGIMSAESIVRYLNDQDIHEGRRKVFETIDIPLKRSYLGEPEVLWIPPEKRMHFQLYERGFSLYEAIEEARRCLYCGPCVSCKACVVAGIQTSLPLVELNTSKCSGCGICVSACFYSAAQIKDMGDRLVSYTDTFRCKACGMCVIACPSNARKLLGDEATDRVEAVCNSLTHI
ncbi:MAG: FAD-dependent oxidoreductase [Desulfobacterales bacterium]|nr:FAD-dependent oxidoreductase [Desulfobacterales bacterium]